MLKPWTNTLLLGAKSKERDYRYTDRFSVVRVETTGPLPVVVQKSSTVPALLVSTFVQPVSDAQYRLWLEGKRIRTGGIPALRTNVVDLAAEPEMWADKGLDYVHFHVRRSTLNDTALDLGYERAGGFQLRLADDDLVLAQLTRGVLPYLVPGKVAPLVLDHLELILCAHLLQHHGVARLRRVVKGGLAAWQQRRALELLRENLDGEVGLAALARECQLSTSHFARAFKATFGTTAHRWLTLRRIDRAKELLAQSHQPLAVVAMEAGFSDQAAFNKMFRRVVGITPGRWRRERV